MKKLLIILLILVFVYFYLDNKNEVAPIRDWLIGRTQRMTGQKTSDMTLEQALMSGKPVIAKLGASWCPPCRQMAPIIEELKTEMEGQAIVLDIDIQQRPDLSKKYKVTYIPLTLFFNGQGQLMDQQVGFMTKQQVLAKFHSM